MVFILLPLTFKTQLSEGGKHLRDALFNSAKKRKKKKTYLDLLLCMHPYSLPEIFQGKKKLHRLARACFSNQNTISDED